MAADTPLFATSFTGRVAQARAYSFTVQPRESVMEEAALEKAAMKQTFM